MTAANRATHSDLTHLDDSGAATMVDVADKTHTSRLARASALLASNQNPCVLQDYLAKASTADAA